jgi:hypothetical protein
MQLARELRRVPTGGSGSTALDLNSVGNVVC